MRVTCILTTICLFYAGAWAASVAVGGDTAAGTADISVNLLQIQPRALDCIADVADGSKRIYAEAAQNYTWFEARSYCTKSDLAIASVRAGAMADDYNDLNQAAPMRFLGAGIIYWTSGRDRQDWQQFLWDDVADASTAVDDPTEANTFFPNPPKYRTCVAFMVMKDGSRVRLAGLDCQERHGVLCQGPVTAAPCI